MNFPIRHLAISLFLCIGSASAQVPSTPGVTFHAEYYAGPTAGSLCFSYTVSNPPSNSAPVASIAIDIAKSPSMASVGGEGITDGPGIMTKLKNVVLRSGRATPMIPAGISAPAGWEASLSVDGRVVWLPITGQLDPGLKLSGLGICSLGLPGIRRYFAQPYVDIETVSITPPNGTPADLQRYKMQLNALENGSGTVGHGVGPVGPPANFVPMDFLQAIISYKEQAYTIGWIDNGGIANSLDAKLNAAQRALERGNNNAARNELEALVHEVDAQASKHLTSEAVALLKFNTQYLISKLP